MQGKVYRYTGAMADPLSLWRSLNLLGDAWWFGWSETAMYLPQRLNGSIPQADWERLSIFNGEAELRHAPCGDKNVILLLAETIEPQGEWKLYEQCPKYTSAQHILLGDPPKAKSNDTSPIEAGTHILVDLAHPVQFTYGNEFKLVAGRVRMRVVVEVYLYYDKEHRLRFTRYHDIGLHEFAER